MPWLGLGVWKSTPGAETEQAVSDALALGYRSIDTATLYRNEQDVGAALQRSGLDRAELFVTTKVWNDDQGYEPTLRAAEASLRRLRLDYVDLYLIHWPVPGRFAETWRALERLRSEGKCRSIGVSNFTIAHLEELARGSSTAPAVNQVEFHPFVYDPALLEFCRARRIQVEAYAPLTRGHRLSEPGLVELARHHRVSPAQVLIRWGLQHGLVEIPKSVHRARIAENAQVFGFELSAEEMRAMDGWRDGGEVSSHPAWSR